MEKNNNSNNRDGLLLRDRSPATTTTTTTATSSSDFVLQWGNRKRLRCMKVQQQQQQAAKDKESAAAAATVSGTPPVGQRSITARVDRRIIRSPNHQTKEVNGNGNGNGYINLRQRSSSPAHRVTQDSKRGAYNSTTTTTTTTGGHHHHHNGKNNNGGGGGGGSGSSETAAKGGTSPGRETVVPMVWPPKFVIGLTNKEKEEDFLAIKGSKLPQRPKKRAKFIQRTINLVSPGGWLCDLTLERYEVREKKISKKRPRGLKAMGSMESDSE
ncbi:hypothetical protein OSB04_029967 [Centaurea solstitialis]|uniref:Uncharacterized protein n=1 Tax=Centaurea solstitialis TaxID=347529 RepID=A0AA38S7V5_9ASTR|nr:hypothetical protein OSB04_029967 [Centaurea solstitialis]